MTDGITVRILGDFGPFSTMGKSIGYQLFVGESNFLVDCGAPLFEQIGGHRLKGIDGLLITHCHDDHKRWFTDLTLFSMYAPDVRAKVVLLTTEEVRDELARSSAAALDRSLSGDSMTVRDIPFSDYVDFQCLGPRAKYRIVSKDEGEGRSRLTVVDAAGAEVGPEQAKIVISDKTGRARMLFRDPEYREWVEPESFYPFSSSLFYEENKNIIQGQGFTLEAVKAPVWHGIPATGVRVATGSETLVFSSDTVNDPRLWKRLCSEKRPQRLELPAGEFTSARVLQGSINDYIERIWSEERYRDALRSFEDAVVIQDVSIRSGVVHTDYEVLKHTTLRKDRTILTHAPDRLTSEWVLCHSEKWFKIIGDKFFEIVDGRVLPFDADIYHKDKGKYFVGYRSETGACAVHDNGGVLSLSTDETRNKGREVFRVDLYEDIGGRYFEMEEDPDAAYTVTRSGQVELVRFTPEGLRGTVATDRRGAIRGRPKGPR